MADGNRNTVSCSDLQERVRRLDAITAEESAHVEGCEGCLETWLDATVTQALDAKPAVKIPVDFATRVAAHLPEKQSIPAGTRSSMSQKGRHWGLITAIVLVAGGLIGTAIADPAGLTTRMGGIFLLIAASEVAGIALWLGIGRSGEGRS
jgi:hypothetical protein